MEQLNRSYIAGRNAEWYSGKQIDGILKKFNIEFRWRGDTPAVVATPGISGSFLFALNSGVFYE